jgi:hypothetical protein
MNEPTAFSDKFKEAARGSEVDDDETSVNEHMKRLVKQKPDSKKSGGYGG